MRAAGLRGRAQVASLPARDRQVVWAAFAALLAIGVGHGLLETARDALFLARFPAARLPWVYLAMVALAALLSRIEAARGPKRTGLVAPLAAGAVVTAALGAVIAWGGTAGTLAAPALYLWAGTFSAWAVARVWARVGARLDVGEAKRTFGLIGAGAGLGMLVGAVAARLLLVRLPAWALVPAAAGAFLVAAFGPAGRLRRRPAEAERAPSAAPAPAPASPVARTYLRQVLLVAAVATAAAVVVDVVWKTELARRHPGPTLAAELANVNLATTALSLLVQALVAGAVVRGIGVHGAALVLPAALAGAAGAALAGAAPLLLSAVLLKGVDGSLRHSLHRTTLELLQLPLPDGLRARSKPLLDVLGHRGGQAAGALLLLGLGALGVPTWVNVLALLGLLAVWILGALALRGRYAELYARALPDERATVPMPAIEVVEAPGLPVAPYDDAPGAAFARRHAASALERLLLADTGRARAEAVAALAGLRRKVPDLGLDEDVLARAAHATAVDAAMALRWRLALEAAGVERGEGVLGAAVSELRRREAVALTTLFQILSLRDPNVDFLRLLAAVTSDDPRARATSRELLELHLGGPAQAVVLALVGDEADEERLRRLLGDRAAAVPAIDEALAEMREAGEGALVAWAARPALVGRA